MKITASSVKRFLMGYGLVLFLLGVIGYKLVTTYIPLWMFASDLEGQDISAMMIQDESGRMVPLSTFRGAPLILNFWASWCLPCKVELPQLASVYPDLVGQGKKLLAVNVQEDWQTINTFRKDMELPFPVYRDQGKLTGRLGISIIPALAVISSEGKIVTVVYGYRPWVGWYLKWWV